MENINKKIGKAVGKTAAYAVKGMLYSRASRYLHLHPVAIVTLKTGAQYGYKVLSYTAEHYARKDFSSETIFNDAVDSSFSAY